MSLQPNGLLWRLDGSRFHMSVPGVADYTVIDGDISAFPAPEAPPDSVAQIAEATPRAAAHFQRGHLALHAAAVVPPNASPAHASVICGMSWTGKSTLAAELAERGWQVLEDDLVPVALGASGLPVLAERPEVPVRWVILLRLPGGSELSVKRATGAKIFDLLTRSVYQSHVADALLEPASFARLVSSLATNVEVWQLDRPRGVDCIEDVADLVARVTAHGDASGGAGADSERNDA